MHQGKLVFAQLMALLPLCTYRRCVADHRGEHKVKDFSCLDQFFAMDFARLFVIHEAKAFFVTRAKRNTQFMRRYSHPVDRINTAVICDQTGELTNYQSSKDYPAVLRRVAAKDDKGKRLVFLINNLTLTPELIADLYRQR